MPKTSPAVSLYPLLTSMNYPVHMKTPKRYPPSGHAKQVRRGTAWVASGAMAVQGGQGYPGGQVGTGCTCTRAHQYQYQAKLPVP